MELRDLIVTPIIIFLVYAGAYWIRPYVTDSINRRYFIPALTVRIIGALAVGFIYQFYYEGGDTFNFHTHGSRHIWEAFMENPRTGIKLLFANGRYGPDTFDYATKIWYFKDHQSYFVICIASIFDLLTFSSYSSTAVLFSLVGFSGSWVMYKTFYGLFPAIHKWAAIACLFIPTVVFWGSGIFKDTITLAALGWITFGFYRGFILRKEFYKNFLIVIISFWVIYSIKKYILLSFLPSLLLWIYTHYASYVKLKIIKLLLAPLTFITVLFLGYISISMVGEDDPRYELSKLAMTAKVTAYDIRYGWGARTGEGSGYTLGELDGTWQSMVRLAPQAINVALFRPYVWEINNPLMLLSAAESLIFLILTIYILIKANGRIVNHFQKPEIIFCFSFALIFSFAVGISTFNFGTLSRYKIPMEPFYMMGIGLFLHQSKSDKKLRSFDATE